jgi:hypothetical protein
MFSWNPLFKTQLTRRAFLFQNAIKFRQSIFLKNFSCIVKHRPQLFQESNAGTPSMASRSVNPGRAIVRLGIVTGQLENAALKTPASIWDRGIHWHWLVAMMKKGVSSESGRDG